MLKRSYILLAIAGLVGTMSSCKKALDINVDPNNSTQASINLVLPSALGYTTYNFGNPFQILGGLWGQYWTQGPTASQYKALDQYVITSTSYNTQWQSLYAGPLQDLKYIITEGTASGRNNYAAIGKIMQAYIYQYLTDLHGDIPFSQALDPANPTPAFDTQEQVYDGLITLLNEGLDLINESSSDHPTNDDLYFQGDMQLWKKFANTLKLRVYLRQSYVRAAVAQAGIQAMYAAGAQFLGTGEDVDMQFTNTTFNQNPLFMTFQALTEANLIASNTALQYQQGNSDPRIDIFYQRATAAPNAGNHFGIDQGDGANLPGALNDKSYSKPGFAVGGPIGGADAPVILMSAAESYFLQAEAVLRGWGTGDAAALYASAARASFAYWGLTNAQATTYLGQAGVVYPAAGTLEERLDAIITQKWISMDGTQNLEGWTEWRRTGYPDIFHVSESTNIGNVFPVRLLYPDTEVARNPNTPAQKSISDKVWWDVNTTGQN
jgi:Starch-binding associating with outer membrane